MFDWVRYSAPCTKCGTVITDWQSKDANRTLSTIEISEVEIFYGDCYKCKTWQEYRVTASGVEFVTDDYQKHPYGTRRQEQRTSESHG